MGPRIALGKARDAAARRAFVHDGVEYSLSHLDERIFTVADASGIERKILVTFSDHCFTCEGNGDGDTAPKFHTTERVDGRFSFERYKLSLGIGTQIDFQSLGNVWSGDRERFLVVRGGYSDLTVHYVLPFSLDPVKGLGVHLHMRIRSAHPRDENPIATFGSVSFPTLVKLRIARKQPPRNWVTICGIWLSTATRPRADTSTVTPAR